MLACDVCSWPGYIGPERSPAILLAHYCNLECIVGAETPCGKVNALNATNSLQILSLVMMVIFFLQLNADTKI